MLEYIGNSTFESGYVCPICLEPCKGGEKETCENGHAIHRQCAVKMSCFMQLCCPLCRAKIVCLKCKSRKDQIRCECDCKVNNSQDILKMMKTIYFTHFWLTFAILALPMQEVLMGSAFLLLNTVVMIRRIVSMQRQAKEIESWSAMCRFGLSITHIGMDLMCIIFSAAIAFLLYSRFRTALFIKIAQI